MLPQRLPGKMGLLQWRFSALEAVVKSDGRSQLVRIAGQMFGHGIGQALTTAVSPGRSYQISAILLNLVTLGWALGFSVPAWADAHDSLDCPQYRQAPLFGRVSIEDRLPRAVSNGLRSAFGSFDTTGTRSGRASLGLDDLRIARPLEDQVAPAVLNGNASQAAFAGRAGQGSLDALGQQFGLSARAGCHDVWANLSAPYVWMQSRDGGYYDASGHIKSLVPGDQLPLYGGKFGDGSPVPCRVLVNGAHHVYFEPGLTSPYFWRGDLGP